MKKKSILLEIFIWLLLTGALAFSGIFFLTDIFENKKSYQVIFKDVDSLQVGSPVRIMGIQAGYVSEVKPIYDQVFVRFKITEDNITIPKGSLVSIQFTGLAGSKSLEIEPPKANKQTYTEFSVVEPIRIQSLIEVQARISESVLSNSRNTLDFFGKNGLETIKKNIKYSAKTTKENSDKLKDTGEVVKNINTTLSENLSNTKDFLETQNEQLDSVNNFIKESSIDKETKKALKQYTLTTQKTYKAFEDGIVQKNSSKVTNKLQIANTKLHNYNSKINQNPDFLSKFSTSFKTSLDSLNKMFDFIRESIKQKQIDSLHKKCNSFKDSSECLKNNI